MDAQEAVGERLVLRVVGREAGDAASCRAKVCHAGMAQWPGK